MPDLIFARQLLPDARPVTAASIRAWATLIAEAVIGSLPDEQQWSLHVYPFKPVVSSTRPGARAVHSQARRSAPAEPRTRSPEFAAAPERCRLIREAVEELLQKRRRHLLRRLRREPGVFAPEETLVQLLLTAPDHGFLSIARSPVPFERRHVVSCFPGGQVAPSIDKRAPSRAFAKLVEAEARLGRPIRRNETCVDLGAAPGSWTYVPVQRGARVTAVDRAELRPDLMKHPRVRFQRGDAFRFQPEEPTDWLLCDVIAAAERSADLLLHWLRRGWCRHFVVTLKLAGDGSAEVLERLQQELPPLTRELWLMRLCANKKEVCAFGIAGERGGPAGGALK